MYVLHWNVNVHIIVYLGSGVQELCSWLADLLYEVVDHSAHYHSNDRLCGNRSHFTNMYIYNYSYVGL